MDSNDKKWLIENSILSKLQETAKMFSEYGSLAEKLKFDVPKLSSYDRYNRYHFESPIERALKIIKEDNEKLNMELEEQRQKEEEYKQELLKTLKNIESNTVGLNGIVPLLTKNIENQEEITELLKEALKIAASKTKQEAESKWRAFMNKTTHLTKDVETILKLQGFANTIFSMVKDLL